MDKYYISPQQLLEDAYMLAWQVFESGYQPDFVIGVWRGGTPVGIAVHELLSVVGVEADHTAIRCASYTGIAERQHTVQVDGLAYVVERVRPGQRLLLVDDVHDTGLTLEQIITQLQQLCGDSCPEIRVATPWYKPGNNRSRRRPDYYLHETGDWLVFPHELDGLDIDEMRANKPELAPVIDQLAAHLQQS